MCKDFGKYCIFFCKFCAMYFSLYKDSKYNCILHFSHFSFLYFIFIIISQVVFGNFRLWRSYTSSAWPSVVSLPMFIFSRTNQFSGMWIPVRSVLGRLRLQYQLREMWTRIAVCSALRSGLGVRRQDQKM